MDFENENQPVIQIIQRASDDVRDRLISAFLARLGGDSSWCSIKWEHYAPHDAADKYAKIVIRAIKPEDLSVHLPFIKTAIEKDESLRFARVKTE